ncbi:MAG: hypothetical protein LAP40_21635 [Acidobacteriia bacterium]|nr:hypothetical protein [Terriglobia bacterium]
MDRHETVQFLSNTPVEVAFQCPEGKLVDTAFGRKTMYALVDGRVLFAEAELATKINFAEPQPGKALWITKRNEVIGTGRKRRRRAVWEVSAEGPSIQQSASTGPRSEGETTAGGAGIQETPIERQLRESNELREAAANRIRARLALGQRGDAVAETQGPAKEPPRTEESAMPTSPEPPSTSAEEKRPIWYQPVVATTNHAVDALADCRRHAERHGRLVTSEDVRSILITVIINKQKRSA